MSKAFEIYKNHFYYADYNINDEQLDSDFLNLLTEEERIIVEKDFVDKFSKNSWDVISYIPKLKYYNGLVLLKNKLNENIKDKKYSIAISILLYGCTKDDNYLNMLYKYVDIPTYASFIFALLEDYLKEPSVGLIRFFRYAVINCKEPSIKKGALLKLLIISGMVETYYQAKEEYSSEISAISNKDVSFDLEKFVDGCILPNIISKIK